MRRLLFALMALCLTQAWGETRNPAAVTALADRVGGSGTASRFTFVLTDDPASEQFIICADEGRPCIKGSTLSALTAGFGWYLNHYAHCNLSWNALSTSLAEAQLPVPEKEESHTSDATYRYYLNYCTFSYSMTTWTWERWQQEIDWMALHGINMPLQIVGLDAVWRNMLKEDYGYSDEDVNKFVAGPAYQAWWGMNNLEGTGGPNPVWWYERQAALAQKILERERSLGMQPVLPGFAGTIPSDRGMKVACESQGSWAAYQRPYIMDPSSADFQSVAANYYKHLERIMGKSDYYSMDPFHEGGTISSGKYAQGYRAIFDAMNAYCGDQTKWVIQQWQWYDYQKTSLTAVPAGRLVVLDLFSDGSPRFDSYAGYTPQDAIYCTIPNFGGRTGFFGRLPKMADNYFTYKQKYSSVKGIGAAPEAIEQTPVVYDLLFELPWMGAKPDVEAWMKDYVQARYTVADGHGEKAWNLLLNSALNNTTTLQGPHEAIVCARPSLTVDRVSTWGGSTIFYDTQDLIQAAAELLEVKVPESPLAAQNYSYDLTDIMRQALTDYSKALLAGINAESKNATGELFKERSEAFLELILDLDELLGTNKMFRLGHWTALARAIADEAEGTTDADRDWLELDNARTLITTWGDKTHSDTGLRDYSYREWQGLLRDYYYPRWQYFFEHGMKNPTTWFYTEWNWAHELQGKVGAVIKGREKKAERTYYTAEPQGDTYEVAHRLFHKYFIPVEQTDGTVRYEYLHLLPDEVTIWGKPHEDLTDWKTLESYKQYVNSITVETRTADGTQGTPTVIYSTDAIPTALYQTARTVEVEQGGGFTLSWAGNDGLQYCYLTAWIDTTGGGTFDKLVTSIGTPSSTNSAVCNGSVAFTLPESMTAGTETRVRLRFDSAWNVPTSPTAATTRFVYDIPVKVLLPEGLMHPGIQSSVQVPTYDLMGRPAVASTTGIVIADASKTLR